MWTTCIRCVRGMLLSNIYLRFDIVLLWQVQVRTAAPMQRMAVSVSLSQVVCAANFACSQARKLICNVSLLYSLFCGAVAVLTPAQLLLPYY